MRALQWCERNRDLLLGVAIIATLIGAGHLVAGDPALDPPPAVALELEAVPVPEVVPATTSPSSTSVAVAPPPTVPPPPPAPAPATVTATAERLEAVVIVSTVPPLGVDGDCPTWRPLLEWFGFPWEDVRPIAWRESRCTGLAFNGNSSTGDRSFGLLQVNRYGNLGAWWDTGGFTEAVMSTEVGALAAAATLFGACGWGPWTRPYGCHDYQTVPSPAWSEWAELLEVAP